jgi:hypothetical protein
MSTRSQLRFVQGIDADSAGGPNEDRQRIAQVYRHCDGYPASVLRELAQLKQLLDATRTKRGPSHAAAQLLLLDKLGTMELYLDDGPDWSIHADKPAEFLDPANMKHLDQPMFLLGHGSRILRMVSTATRSPSTSSNCRRVPPSTSLASGPSR